MVSDSRPELKQTLKIVRFEAQNRYIAPDPAFSVTWRSRSGLSVWVKDKDNPWPR
jgi:hypothetical protein